MKVLRKATSYEIKEGVGDATGSRWEGGKRGAHKFEWNCNLSYRSGGPAQKGLNCI